MGGVVFHVDIKHGNKILGQWASYRRSNIKAVSITTYFSFVSIFAHSVLCVIPLDCIKSVFISYTVIQIKKKKKKSELFFTKSTAKQSLNLETHSHPHWAW